MISQHAWICAALKLVLTAQCQYPLSVQATMAQFIPKYPKTGN